MAHSPVVRALAAAGVALAVAAGSALAQTAPNPAASPAPSPGPIAGQTLWLASPLGRLKAVAYASPHLSAHPRLVVVLHGDAPFARPDYQYLFARRAAAVLDDTVAVAILRPGYTDPQGDTSAGKRGRTNGDNYTLAAVNGLSAAVAELRSRFAARNVTLVGHSGGAVLAALLLEQHPELAAHALLVACPCDVPAWRFHMARKQLSPIWLAPVHSLSPKADAARLSRGAAILLLVGERDDVAPLRLSNAFADAARRARADVRVEMVSGGGHDILLDPAVMTALQRFQPR